MDSKLPNSFRRVFTTRTSHQLTSKTSLKRLKILIKNYWINNYHNKCKKRLWFLHAKDNIGLKSNQGDIKDNL